MIAEPETISLIVARWLDSHEPDDHCSELHLPYKFLRPIVAARCAKRADVLVPIKKNSPHDPCVCGCQTSYHMECYFHFVFDQQHESNRKVAATEESALAWRMKISQEVPTSEPLTTFSKPNEKGSPVGGETSEPEKHQPARAVDLSGVPAY